MREKIIRILVDMPLDPGGYRPLDERPDCDIRMVDSEEDRRKIRTMPEGLIGDRHLLFCRKPPANLSVMGELAFIQINSVGYAQLYGLDLVERGIRASNGRGIYDAPIAEWNISMMINLVRNLRQIIGQQDQAVWRREPRYTREIRGGTLGIWGYGGIGRETARLAKSFGMRIHVMTRNGAGPRPHIYRLPGVGDPEGRLPDSVYIKGQEGEFLSQLDFLLLAMPLTPQTEGIIGEKELKALPNGAYLLNPARGALVEEKALLQALREGWVAGAALDAHFQEPLAPEHPLWSMANVILTPHISGSFEGPYTMARIWDVFAQNVERFATGQPLLNELTPKELNGA